MYESTAKKEVFQLPECPHCNWEKNQYLHSIKGYSVNITGYSVDFHNEEDGVHESCRDLWGFEVHCSNCDAEITAESIIDLLYDLV
jgi:hypothetical protein